MLREGDARQRARAPRLRRRAAGRLQGAARRSSSSTRSPRARPASCSGSVWRQNSGSRDADCRLRRGRDRRLPRRQARGGRPGRTVLVARGAHLEAIRDKGLTLVDGGDTKTHPVKATARAEELGVQDYVVLALKAHSLAGTLDRIAPLIGDDTAVVTMQNGVPWWYFYKLAGPFKGTRLE